MSNPYARQATAALRILKAKGQAMRLYRVTVETYDPVKPYQADLSARTSCDAFGIVLPASNSILQLFFRADDAILTDPARRHAFRYVILAGLGLTVDPQADDVLITGEGAYRLIGATRLDPTGQGVILWQVGCTLDVSFVIPTDEQLALTLLTESGEPLVNQDGEAFTLNP